MLRQFLFDRAAFLNYGGGGTFVAAAFLILAIWTLFWKGIALWKAARNSQKYWFVALLVIGSAGILEILYLAFFQRKRK